jgi:hypothetical protein
MVKKKTIKKKVKKKINKKKLKIVIKRKLLSSEEFLRKYLGLKAKEKQQALLKANPKRKAKNKRSETLSTSKDKIKHQQARAIGEAKNFIGQDPTALFSYINALRSQQGYTNLGIPSNEYLRYQKGNTPLDVNIASRDIQYYVNAISKILNSNLTMEEKLGELDELNKVYDNLKVYIKLFDPDYGNLNEYVKYIHDIGNKPDSMGKIEGTYNNVFVPPGFVNVEEGKYEREGKQNEPQPQQPQPQQQQPQQPQQQLRPLPHNPLELNLSDDQKRILEESRRNDLKNNDQIQLLLQQNRDQERRMINLESERRFQAQQQYASRLSRPLERRVIPQQPRQLSASSSSRRLPVAQPVEIPRQAQPEVIVNPGEVPGLSIHQPINVRDLGVSSPEEMRRRMQEDQAHSGSVISSLSQGTGRLRGGGWIYDKKIKAYRPDKNELDKLKHNPRFRKLYTSWRDSRIKIIKSEPDRPDLTETQSLVLFDFFKNPIVKRCKHCKTVNYQSPSYEGMAPEEVKALVTEHKEDKPRPLAMHEIELLKEEHPIQVTDDLKKIEQPMKETKGDGREENSQLIPHDGTSDTEINRIMGRHPGYLGTVSVDELKSLILPKVQKNRKQSFIFNLGNRRSGGYHWVGVKMNPREIVYYNPYGDNPPASFLNFARGLGRKLIINKVKNQDENTTDCAYHSMKFLMTPTRFKKIINKNKGVKDNHEMGEAKLTPFIKKYKK